jgi:hypothetical protein
MRCEEIRLSGDTYRHVYRGNDALWRILEPIADAALVAFLLEVVFVVTLIARHALSFQQLHSMMEQAK